MILKELRIRLLPGIDEPFTLQPNSGVNLVVGPNASGKSSFVRAVRDLLWPELHAEGVRSLRAVFVTHEADLTVTCDGPAPVWHRGGAVVAPPHVPPEHLAPCYVLSAPELLGADQAFDRRLAGSIRTEMTGGFDLDRLAGELKPPAARGAHDLERGLREAREQVARVERIQVALAARRDGLAELEARIAEAEAAGLRRAALEARRDLRDAQRNREEAAAALAGFPEAMVAVRPDDDETFVRLQREQATQEARRAETAAECQEIEQTLAALQVPAGTEAGTGLLARAAALAAACSESSRAAELAHNGCAVLVRTLQAAEAADENGSGESILARLHGNVTDLGAGLEALTTEEQTAAEGAGGRERIRAALLLAAGAVTALLAASPLLRSAPLRLAAAGGAVLLFVLGALRLAVRSRDEALREQRRRWAVLAEEARRRRDELAAHRANLVQAIADRDEADRRLHVDLAALGDTLAAWSLPAPATAAAAAAAVEELGRRLARRDELAQRLARARRDRDEATRADASLRDQLAALLERLLLPGDLVEAAPIKTLVERLPAWRAAHEAWRAADADVRNLEREATRRAEAAALPDAAPADDLDVLIQESTAAAAEAAGLREDLGSLRQEIRAADAGHDLAAALAREQACRDELAAWCARARGQLAETALLDELRQQHETSATTPRLREANRLLSAFTRDRYGLSLGLSEGGPTFAIRDRDAGGDLELAQLSDGTRAQVLLALRVAFLTGIESGTRPPLFLDEALTTSDPERMAAVASCLGSLTATTGRQVFYLTSQPADVGAWRGALADAGLPEPTVLDLAAARSRGAAADPADLAPLVPPPVPRPTGHEPASYGALLGVRRLDPREPWQRTDTFHLAAPDLDLVHVLRSAGFVSAGTLAHVLPRLVRTAIVDNAQSRRLGRNLEVLRAFGAAWRVGRPRPATVADIDRSGAVSETFRPRALELLEEARGNAARFLAAAPGGIPRFQARKLEALREHLTEAGCVDDRDPLDDEEIVSSVLLRVASAPDAEARTPVDEVRARVHYLLRAIPQEIVDDPSSRSSGSDPTG